MPRHTVSMSLPRGLVLNTDVEFEVNADDVKLGELHLSRGTVDWRPAHARTEYRLEWERFAALMVEHGRPTREA